MQRSTHIWFLDQSSGVPAPDGTPSSPRRPQLGNVVLSRSELRPGRRAGGRSVGWAARSVGAF